MALLVGDLGIKLYFYTRQSYRLGHVLMDIL